MGIPRPDDELSFHFRLDRRLVARTNRFVFTVSVEGGAGEQIPRGSVKSQVQRVTTTATTTTASVQWCLPPLGNPLQSVRASDGGVCVLGNATMLGPHPDAVVGRIYSPPQASYPDKPPSDFQSAQIVNAPGYPDFTSPSPCGTVNFVFHPAFANELKGAKHSSSGVGNAVVVWLLTGSAVAGPFVAPFRGVTATGTECPPASEAPSPPHALAADVQQRPAKLSLQVDSPLLAGPVAVPLTRKDAESNQGETVWASCAQANPEARWKLWVMHNNGHPYGVVSLQH